jgi:hypothetical protein
LGRREKDTLHPAASLQETASGGGIGLSFSRQVRLQEMLVSAKYKNALVAMKNMNTSTQRNGSSLNISKYRWIAVEDMRSSFLGETP